MNTLIKLVGIIIGTIGTLALLAGSVVVGLGSMVFTLALVPFVWLYEIANINK